MAASILHAYEAFLDFLIEKVTPAEMLAYKVSPEDQARVEELLDRKNRGIVTPEEEQELNKMLAFERLASLLKAKA